MPVDLAIWDLSLIAEGLPYSSAADNPISRAALLSTLNSSEDYVGLFISNPELKQAIRMNLLIFSIIIRLILT
jgi:hypothetical protein